MKAKAIFNDMNMIRSTLGRLNELGEALAYLTSFEEMESIRSRLETAAESAQDRNQKARLRQRLKELSNTKNLAKSKGLLQDEALLQKLDAVLEYGFQDQFEVQMPLGEHTISANLKRDYLRENEHLLVRKYSRFSEKDFVLFGTVAQSSTRSSDYQDEVTENSDATQMKEVIMQFIGALSHVETSLSGKLENEIIIDPIALYREI